MKDNYTAGTKTGEKNTQTDEEGFNIYKDHPDYQPTYSEVL